MTDVKFDYICDKFYNTNICNFILLNYDLINYEIFFFYTQLFSEYSFIETLVSNSPSA